jgi:hypothetical protein
MRSDFLMEFGFGVLVLKINEFFTFYNYMSVFFIHF